MKNGRLLGIAAAVAALAIGVAGCGGSAQGDSSSPAAKATSAQAAGGMDALIKAAKAEGTLNVITLPRTWANYGAIMDTFTKKYGIKINDANPDGSHARTRSTPSSSSRARPRPGRRRHRLAFALRPAPTACSRRTRSRPGRHPGRVQGRERQLVQRLRRLMSIGYDRRSVKTRRRRFADLLNPDVQGQGRPQRRPDPGRRRVRRRVRGRAGQRRHRSTTSSPASTSSSKLKKAGNFIPVRPTQATIESGQTPVVIDWDYLNVSRRAGPVKGPTGRSSSPATAARRLLQPGHQQDAPHPAAARLWEEFLYSAEGQNLWLQGGARPVELRRHGEGRHVDEGVRRRCRRSNGDRQVPDRRRSSTRRPRRSPDWASAVG